MLNYFKLIRALQTDQYDDFTVRDLKYLFNTESDIDTAPVVLLPEGLNERLGMSIMAHHMASMSGKVIVVGMSPDDPLQSKPINQGPLLLKTLTIEPLIQAAQVFKDEKSLRRHKQQNQFRSRNYKK
jgi:hypothetical protein